MLQFEWNPAKVRTHLRKQGVAFKEAATVFKDPLSFTTHDPDHSCVSGKGAQGLFFSVAGDFSELSSAILRSPGIVNRSYPKPPSVSCTLSGNTPSFQPRFLGFCPQRRLLPRPLSMNPMVSG